METTADDVGLAAKRNKESSAPVAVYATMPDGKVYVVPIERREGKFYSPFRTLENPEAFLFRVDFQGIKKAVRGAMLDERYASQKENLIKNGTIKLVRESVSIKAGATSEEFERISRRETTRGRPYKTIALAAVLTLIIAALLYWGFWSIKTYFRLDDTEDALKEARSALTKAQADLKKLLAEKAASISAGKIKSATLGQGEGINHALKRQLMAAPYVWGFEGDIQNFGPLKKWAETTAHQFAILAGYVDYRTGREIRVRGSGKNVAYVLGVSEGKRMVQEFTIGPDGNFKASPDETNYLAGSYAEAKFQKDLSPYEYMMTP